MNDRAYVLSGWKQFCALCRERREDFCPALSRTHFNRFYARYRLAKNFEAVHARGYSEKALLGYTAGLRLLAAYNAAELLGVATDEQITKWHMLAPKLATPLRKVLSRPSADDSGVFSSKGLKKNLDLFMSGDADVRIAATALRVMVAHGSFTPTGTDSLTKRGSATINRLSNLLLQECEQRFLNWLQPRSSGHYNQQLNT